MTGGSTAAEEGGEREDGWWWKVVDMVEVKKQGEVAVPMVLTNVFYFLIPLISVMFAGHIGQLQLAGSTLANSWATVTGFAFMLGLSGALETLCGQGFGAQLYKTVGLHLQASCIISIFFAIIISIIWWYTEPILILLHQNPDIAKEAANYMIFLIPGIFAFGPLENILRFLQVQSVVLPLTICSFVLLLMHLGLTHVLVHCTSLGYRGAALATSITYWVSVVVLVVYINFAKEFEHTWRGLSMESFRYVFVNLKLAIPSAAMVCLEYWAFEILVLLAGLTPNSEMATSVIAICVNTENIAYNFTYGLSAAASTRVSNEIGAGRPDQAKHAMGTSLKLSILLAVLILLALGLGHDGWANLFSDSTNITESFAQMTPFLCISIFIDSIQGILSGVSRGCGWQHLAMFINLGTFYLIGMPISCLLAFKLGLYSKGLWIGLICGLLAQSASLFLVTHLHKWTTLVRSHTDIEISPLLV